MKKKRFRFNPTSTVLKSVVTKKMRESAVVLLCPMAIYRSKICTDSNTQNKQLFGVFHTGMHHEEVQTKRTLWNYLRNANLVSFPLKKIIHTPSLNIKGKSCQTLEKYIHACVL
jgi:hypothetical protein